MARQAGIPIVALFDSTDQINQALPAQLADFFNRFVAIELDSRTSEGAVIQTGRMQSLDVVLANRDVQDFDLGFAKLRIPGITTGVPFQFSKARADVTADLEPGAQSWQFDLFLTDFTLVFDGLVGARPVKQSGTTPRHLEPLPNRPPVAITGSAALRIEKASADAQPVAKFIDVVAGSDPLLPDAISGFVGQLTCSPPHFVCDKSGFGFTIRDLIYDGSTQSSPPYVIERGQTAEWIGFSLREATVYTPAAAMGTGGLSASLRDFLIGDPAGLQGEIEVQFGRSPLNATTFVFEQDGSNINSGFDYDNGTLDISALAGQSVALTASLTVPAPPATDPDGITDYEAEFAFPNQATITGDSATGQVRHGDTITITPIEVIGTGTAARRLTKPPFTVRMVASGKAPALSVAIGGTDLDNVVDLTGPASDINGLVLTATPDPADPAAVFTWNCAALGISHQGTTLTLSLPAAARGIHHIAVTQNDAADKGPSHLRLRLRNAEDGALLIGCEGGVFAASAPTTALPIADVLGTYDLTTFHSGGTLSAAGDAAEESGGTVTVPAGTIAEVAVDEGGAPATREYDRHVQVLFEFDDSVAQHWGPNEPYASAGSNIHESLLAWAATYPDASFLVIGRCDDVGTDTYNVGLADRRAQAVADLLAQPAGGYAAVTGAVHSFGEQTAHSLSTDEAALVTPDIEEDQGRLINLNDTSDTWPTDSNGNGLRTTPPDPTREAVRVQYRRADIYAVGGTPTADAGRPDRDAVDPTRRRVLVPAAGRDIAPADNDNAKADYRVKLLAGWDRPRFTGARDLIPNLAEIEVAWTPDDDGISLTAEVLTLYGKWIFDDLTGFTEFTVGLTSEGGDGLAQTEQPDWVAALSFGPMLLSGVDFDNDVFGSFARLGALGAVGGFAQIDLGGGPLVGAGSKSTLVGLESKSTTRTLENPFESFKTQFTVSYTNELHINAGALGLKTKEPMKLRYDKVGIEFDNTDPDAVLTDKLGLVYDSDSMTIEDSGLWEISGPLAKLLRVTEFRMGVGSFWVEPTLAVALDLGVVEISEASFRVTFNTDASGAVQLPPEFSLRGLAAKVDIPAALKGEGRLKIEDGGIIKAGIDVTVIPLQIRAAAALAMGSPPEIAPAVFMNLYARVQFPGGIPLGPLPLAIHGFIGQTVINGSRDVADTTDIVTREIGWWRKNPEDKYAPEAGQHALGVGVVMGTLPDASFSFSVTGMVVVAFPDPEVILGVEVNLLSLPDTNAKDKKDGDTAAITGLVVIDDEAVSVAVSAEYEIPEILKVKVPFSAYFPYPGSGKNVYIRLGADNVNGRTGEPITLTLLPSTINLKAWSFLMIEGGGITALGGEAGWDFDGFAIGFGAGAGLEWKAGPIGLSASAKILVGLGTDPLIIKGGLFVNGKLDLVVVSISARGDIVLTYMDPPNAASSLSLTGEFCGEVDLFFFSLKGCVDFSFGSPPAITPPAPPPPVKSVSLTDRMGAIMGEATTGSTAQAAAIFDFVEVDGQSQNQGADPKDNHTVWPDTVPVINFSHFIKDALPASGQFDPSAQPAGEAWFGSSRLKYAYRLDGVTLRRAGGAAVTDPSGTALQSAWTHSPSRAADDTSGANGTPSGAEVTHLQLLNWEPWAWARSTEDGGAGQPGDPATIIERICDPVPAPRRACLLGSAANVISLTEARLMRDTPAPGPYPSKFLGTGQSFVTLGGAEMTQQALTAYLAAQGIAARAGGVVDTPGISFGGQTLRKGYRLPGAESISAAGVRPIALPWRANLDRDVTDGDLLLMVCQSETAPDGGDDKCYMFDDVKPDQKAPRFDLPPFYIAARDPNAPLETADKVDMTNPSDPRLGADGKTEMVVSHPGADIEMKTTCHALEIHFYRPGSGAVTFIVHHNDGSTTQVVSDGPASVPMLATLTSASGIKWIEIEMKCKQILITRVCCTRPGDTGQPTTRDCLNLEALPSRINDTSEFDFDGAHFAALSRSETFRRSDYVDAGQTPPRAGQDGAFELVMPYNGMRVDLPAGCTHLEISVFLGAGPVTVTGLNKDGNKVAEVTSPAAQGVGMTLTLTDAHPIVALEITGGNGEAFIYRICCIHAADPGQPDTNCIDLGALPKALDGQKSGTVQGITITPTPGEHIRLADMVDTDPTPKPGQDKGAELSINRKGIALKLPKGCTDLELHVMQWNNEPVTAEGFDAAGNGLAKDATDGRQGIAHVLRLTADQPIMSVVLTGGGGEAVLYRVCCRDGDVTVANNRCVTFRNARLLTRAARLEQDGIVFADPKAAKALSITDKLTIDGTALKAAADGVNELSFGKNGLTIALPRPCSDVRLALALPKGAGYKLRALGADGRDVAGEGGESIGKVLRIALKGTNIARIEITAASAGLLAEICLREVGAGKAPNIPAGRTSRSATNGAAIALPVVTAEDLDGDGAPSVWPGEIVKVFTSKTDGNCAFVRYRAPQGADAFDRVIVTPQTPAQTITMMALCGVDERAAQWQARDVETREDLIDDLTDTAGADGRPVLLDPDTEYEIAVDWSWQSWVSESENDNAPASPPNGDFTAGTAQTFRFRTAPAANLPTAQDGPNEYIFDPRDLDRYLVGSDPANGAIAHFTDDPVVFHFAHDHVGNLAARYGRALDIEIRRTDPPAQPGGDLSAIIAPLPGVLQILDAPTALLSAFESRMNAALEGKPCIPGIERIPGGTTLAGSFPLEPRVQYDADLMARMLADHDDKARIQASRFMTSRYANPTEMVQALGLDTDGAVAPVPMDELVLDAAATVPGDVAAASDRDFDAAMADMGLDTLALPDGAARMFQIWQPNGAGTAMKLVGILVDALEPLDRTAAVVQGGAVEIVTRCALDHALIDGRMFKAVRRTRNATRVLLAAPAGFAAPVDAATFQLHFSTSDGPLVGRRHLRTIPLVMQIEGF